MKSTKIKTAILYVLIVLLIIAFYNIFLIFGADKNSEKATNFFGYRLFVITSGSMEPTFYEGDIVFVKATDNYSKEDIITYTINNSDIPTTHRIIEIYDDNSYLTQGDNNSFADPSPVPRSNIIGKVVKTIPKIGKGIEITRKVRYLLLVLIALLIFGTIYRSKKEKSKRRKIKKELAINEEENS